MAEKYVTHRRGEDDYQSLRDHLEGVAKRAAEFAKPFGAEAQAERMGWMHDVGKYSMKGQRRQYDPEHHPKVDHSTAGAQEAWRLRDAAAAFAIAGHHGGLPRMGSDKEAGASLLGRVSNVHLEGENDPSVWKQEITLPDCAPLQITSGFEMSFFTRMLFSCLVDADYLDTEEFMSFGRVERRAGEELPVLLERLRAHVRPWLEAPRGELGVLRNRILENCLKGGAYEPGLFTLTVPTGGGKTLASMAFALSHAVKQGKRRVIYVIPYTSIIEQNAKVFEGVLGEENVLEHHSNVDLGGDHDEETEEAIRRRLATENWDSPVVVTTAVQFFESLFANKTSRCRKLHNIADSVIVFDEAQMMPIPYLWPCVSGIAELVRHYGVSAVLCTATQPALEKLFQKAAPGLKATELCPDVAGMFEAFRRVNFVRDGVLSNEELAAKLNGQEQALCIVNSRKRVGEIYDLLQGEGRFHLSTLMTPNHRSKKLREIRKRLNKDNQRPCRVVATSLIEAGVDVDFPTVWREKCGLDSIVQASGRCNREGKRTAEESTVHVFEAEGDSVRMFAIPCAALDFVDRKQMDYGDPATVTKYFRRLMDVEGRDRLDEKNIMELVQRLDFPAIAEQFRMIDENTLTVYIPTPENAEDIERLRQGELSRGLLRRLGRDAVNVYPQHFEELEQAGAIDSRRDSGYGILVNMGCYSEETGLAREPQAGAALFG